ncbi:MAG: DUF2585 family protein [Pyrinomonadaceae bacterium]
MTIQAATKRSSARKLGPWLSMVALFGATAVLLRVEGRLWICSCGTLLMWVGEVCSSNNSQHFFDPYSFTHVLHGFLFFWLIAWLVPRLDSSWQLVLAIVVEGAWEVFENTNFIIERYRTATAALGYNGDTVVNSLGDILCCTLGFMIARRLGFRRSLIAFVALEFVLLLWIRDSLLLEILMLVVPIDVIRTWQMCR